ncbi:MAG TPA: hypothetical protein VGP03_14540 [Pseudonocardiaceae bacterium]|jgi:hypothetical protein|nr:hypothetical protein [Pseudonocardiaceae bacterium]
MSDAGEVRHELARQVRDRLVEAGLPAYLPSDGFHYSGADIEVDLDNEQAGVFVTWQVGEELSRAVTASIINDQADDPSVERSAAITLVMRDALMTILEAEGFSVENSGDHMRPAALQVLSVPAAG